ncbi:F210B-like protein [Mya arenaria]|uniref:F210B-like protein n=1 Tax=Mya arenaria TaxID=6604 RepID=A0ABY7ENT3_MYAAR|nr:uncharacterized protein LOC128244889 [Mya arenaria]WAR11505.1 F210B-like protein [Mya arenaria]
MLSFSRIVPRTQKVMSKGIYSGIQSGRVMSEFPAHIFGQDSVSDSRSFPVLDHDIVCMEGLQGEIRDLSLTEARHVLSQAVEFQNYGPTFQGTQEFMSGSSSLAGSRATPSQIGNINPTDAHSSVLAGLKSHVSLHGHMQSNVPFPQHASEVSGGYGSYHNMPGGSDRLLDKFVSGSLQNCHQSRQFSMSSKLSVTQQGAQEAFLEDQMLTDPSPQGIQGDNCVSFKLWMENCQRYNLPNCDEQLKSLKEGRKTLAEVFQEQQEIIRLVAEDYKRKQSQERMAAETNAQGPQDYYGYSFEFSHNDPCPQGLQGDDCATYKVWANNCKAFGFGDCSQKAVDIQTGRRTLQEVFDEQDELIKKIVSNFQQRRQFSTSAVNLSEVRTDRSQNSAKSKTESVQSQSEKSNQTSENPQSIHPDTSKVIKDIDIKLSQKDRLKRAVKDYGATVIVFHVGISLISLGGFYLAVSSGLDVVGLLTRLGVGESILQSRVAAGSTTFVLAYAVHKVFAPVRIATTLTCTPLIVRYLRRVGFLKQPPKP